MDKILVTIYVLTLEEEYDVLLPINLNMKEALDLIQKTIKELSSDVYEINSEAILYNEAGQLINTNNNVRSSGLSNGCKILLK